MTPETAYGKLIHATREAALLESCAELLGWDEDTFMPPGGVAHRGRQMALLAGLLHDRWTDPRLGDWLARIEGSSLVADPLSAEAVNVRELRRAYDRERRLPRRLLAEIAGARRLPNVAVLSRRYPLQRQRSFAQKVAAAVGFDFGGGRLDSTT